MKGAPILFATVLVAVGICGCTPTGRTGFMGAEEKEDAAAIIQAADLPPGLEVFPGNQEVILGSQKETVDFRDERRYEDPYQAARESYLALVAQFPESRTFTQAPEGVIVCWTPSNEYYNETYGLNCGYSVIIAGATSGTEMTFEATFRDDVPGLSGGVTPEPETGVVFPAPTSLPETYEGPVGS